MNLFLLQSRPASTSAHHSATLRWVAHLGMPGVFLVAALDAFVIPSAIPGSTDLLLLWLVSHRGNPWTLVACAVAGSLVGGYATWQLGKKGGEAALKRYVAGHRLEKIKKWMQTHPLLSVSVPAILPPPIPLSPFILAAGALGVTLRRFLLVFGLARALRYGFVAWLAATYGRHVIRLWSAALDKWSAPIAWTFTTLMIGSIAYGIWKFRRQTPEASAAPALSPAAD